MDNFDEENSELQDESNDAPQSTLEMKSEEIVDITARGLFYLLSNKDFVNTRSVAVFSVSTVLVLFISAYLVYESHFNVSNLRPSGTIESLFSGNITTSSIDMISRVIDDRLLIDGAEDDIYINQLLNNIEDSNSILKSLIYKRVLSDSALSSAERSERDRGGKDVSLFEFKIEGTPVQLSDVGLQPEDFLILIKENILELVPPVGQNIILNGNYDYIDTEGVKWNLLFSVEIFGDDLSKPADIFVQQSNNEIRYIFRARYAMPIEGEVPLVPSEDFILPETTGDSDRSSGSGDR